MICPEARRPPYQPRPVSGSCRTAHSPYVSSRGWRFCSEIASWRLVTRSSAVRLKLEGGFRKKEPEADEVVELCREADEDVERAGGEGALAAIVMRMLGAK